MTITGSVRRQALHDHKRQVILAAAREVFTRTGLAGTTMRAIADAAGYVPGAVYAYFETKEAILGELLVQSLGNMNRAVKTAAASADQPGARLSAAAKAFHACYQANRSELDLSLALLHGGRGAGLAPELERQINGRLIAVLQVFAGAIQQASGLAPAEAEREAVALFAEIAGLLLLEASGRLRVLDQDGTALVARAVRKLLDGPLVRTAAAL